MEIKVYVQNLAKYVSGRHKGRWITLPMGEEELEKIKQDILGNDEELLISDYEAPFKIGEYDRLEKLNEYAQILNDINEEGYIIEAIMKACDTCIDMETRFEWLENHEFTIYEDVVTGKDLAEKIFQEDPAMLPIFEHYEGETQHLIDWMDNNWGFVDWDNIGNRLEECGWEFIKVNGYGDTKYLAVQLHNV